MKKTVEKNTRYVVPANAKLAIRDVTVKRAVQCQTNAQFSLVGCKTANGVNYGNHRAFFARILFNSLTKKRSAAVIDQNGRYHYFVGTKNLKPEGKAIFDELSSSGVFYRTIKRWIERESVNHSYSVIFGRG